MLVPVVAAAPAAAQGPRFPDVPADHYAFEAIEWAATVEVTRGYDDGTFKPARPLSKRHAVVFMERYYDEILGAEQSEDFTRADMMVLLKAINDGTIRSTGAQAPDDTSDGATESPRFPDVTGDHYAFEAVEWAAEVGVTRGYDDGTFKPARPLSKRHAVVFMERYYDEILGAEQSEDFTRADMMVLLKAINDGTIRSTGGFKAVAGGVNHTCAIRADNTVVCWGFNGSGQADAPPGTFKAVAAGWSHSCAIRTDDTITCWGYNNDGRADPPAGTFKAVAVGWDHSCAIRTDDTITCWGKNEEGQSNAPAGTYEAVAGGGEHTCAIRADDTITCWGSNEYGQTDAPEGSFKALAASSANNCALGADDTITCWGTSDSGVPAGSFKAVATGGSHGCGLRSDDTIACWGYNGDGRADSPAGTYGAIATGSQHSCAIGTDGMIACWGDNRAGQTDVPTATDEAERPPGTVETTPEPDTEATATSGFAAVSAGTTHACGLRADNTVACWGDDTFDQAQPPEGQFISVSAGKTHACGVRTDSTVQCWGDNQWQQSGTPSGDTIRCSVRNGRLVCKQPYDPPQGQFLSVSAGAHHSCGLRTDNTVHCWGFVRLNDEGLPTALMVAPSGQFISVSSGSFHACGVRADNTLACWGDETWNQDLEPDGTFVSVSPGGAHTCGVRSDGKVQCWGNNDFTQSGTAASGASCSIGTGGSRCVQVFRPLEGQFVSVSAGWVHSCGVRNDNTLQCWGSNAYGQLTVPSGKFVSVSAGDGFTCGVRTGNTIECWGINEFGESTPPAA